MIAGTLPMKMCFCQHLVMKITAYLDKFSQGWELPLLQPNTVDSTKKESLARCAYVSGGSILK